MPALDFFSRVYRDQKHTKATNASAFDLILKEGMVCTQRAGDIMYVPPLWGHSTFNTMQTIGVAHEFSVEGFSME